MTPADFSDTYSRGLLDGMDSRGLTTSAHVVITHQDLVTLVFWMRDELYEVDRIVDAIEKPWAWQAELLLAKASRKAAS